MEYPDKNLEMSKHSTACLMAMNAMAEDSQHPLAIMCVVRNRVNHSNKNLFRARYKDENKQYHWTYPDDPYKGVILYPWGFSWLWAGDKWSKLNRERVLNTQKGSLLWENTLYPLSLAITQGEPFLEDITQGSTHYYQIGTKAPEWSKTYKPTIQIGNQKYFKY